MQEGWQTGSFLSDQDWRHQGCQPYRYGATHALARRKAKLKVYSGAPHGLTVTHREQVSADLLAFIEG